MYSRQQILSKIAELMEELFEIPPDRVQMDAKLYEDLDLDSIDAVDLIVRLQEFVERRVEPSEFKGVRTIGDVVQVVEVLVREPATLENEK